MCHLRKKRTCRPSGRAGAACVAPLPPSRSSFAQGHTFPGSLKKNKVPKRRSQPKFSYLGNTASRHRRHVSNNDGHGMGGRKASVQCTICHTAAGAPRLYCSIKSLRSWSRRPGQPHAGEGCSWPCCPHYKGGGAGGRRGGESCLSFLMLQIHNRKKQDLKICLGQPSVFQNRHRQVKRPA